MTLSVIIPCYNAGATVRETIESALSQDVALEVIAIDDGSRDATADVLRDFGDRIRAVFGPNRGVSAARNSGLELATGEWIQFLDSDDLLTPGTLAARLSAGADADVVICDWQEFTEQDGEVCDGDLRRIDVAGLEADAELATAGHAWAPPAAVLYRRSLAERIGGFRTDLPVIQDARYLFDAARAGGRFACSAHVGARYRVLPDSLSRRRPQAFWDDVVTNGLQIEALWREDGPLTPDRSRVLAGIYEQATRGLLACGGPRYFEAVAGQKRMGHVSKHGRVSSMLAGVVGLKAAQRIVSLVKAG